MLPKTTHQQNVVLSLLQDGSELYGREIRDNLRARGHISTDASFYEMMDRLEIAGMVEGKFGERVVEGEVFRGKYYKIMAPGIAAWNRVQELYWDLLAKSGKSMPGRI